MLKVQPSSNSDASDQEEEEDQSDDMQKNIENRLMQLEQDGSE